MPVAMMTFGQLKAGLLPLLSTIVTQKVDRQPEMEQHRRNSYWHSPDVYDVIGAANYLNLSKSYISQLATAGKIPCSKAFGRMKFERCDLDAWAASKIEKRGDHSSVTMALAKSAQRKLKSKTVKV